MTWQGNLDLKGNKYFCGGLERSMSLDRQTGSCYSQLKQLADLERIMVCVLDIHNTRETEFSMRF